MKKLIKCTLFGILSFFIFLAFTLTWKVYFFGRLIKIKELPEWRVDRVVPGHWILRSVEDPLRVTDAWIKGPDQPHSCDTLIMIAGVAEGSEFLKFDNKVSSRANTILMRQPLKDFARPETFEDWGLWDWWNLPKRVRLEFIQNVGALKALVDYIHLQSKTIDSPFSEKIVLAGGSMGAPVPAILSSFFPEKVSGLMIIYGFTNFVIVIRNEIYRQGLNHFGINELAGDWTEILKQAFLRMTAHILSWYLGNMLKYGQIELYLPQVHGIPIHFINGERDHLITDETYLPMWETASHPKSEYWLESGHINPGNPNEVHRIIKLMDEWAFSQKLRECLN